MSGTDDPPNRTQWTSGTYPTYNRYVPPPNNYIPPTYNNAPAPTFTDAPPPTYLYAPPTYQAPPPAPARPFIPAPVQEAPQQGSAYYKNCSAARAAGAAPLRKGDPGYRAGLDRDDDDIACE